MARKALAKSNLLRFSDAEYDNRSKGGEANELFAPTFKAFVFHWSPAFTSQGTGEPGILTKCSGLKLAIRDALKAMDNLTILPLANFAARPHITP